MRADESVRVEGLAELRRALRAVESGTSRELNKGIRKAMGPVELVASARTPRDSGRLQQSNRVQVTARGVALVNRQPYANAIHWGRKEWPRKGHPRATPSAIKPRPWLYDTLQEQRGVIAQTVIRELDRFIRDELPRSS